MSLEEAQKFGYEQDLSVTEEKTYNSETAVTNTINVEKWRSGSKRSEQIDVKLDQIENFKENEFTSISFSDDLPSLDVHYQVNLMLAKKK